MRTNSISCLTPKEMKRARENEGRIRRAAIHLIQGYADQCGLRERVSRCMDDWYAEMYFFSPGLVVKDIRKILARSPRKKTSELDVNEIVEKLSGGPNA